MAKHGLSERVARVVNRGCFGELLGRLGKGGRVRRCAIMRHEKNSRDKDVSHGSLMLKYDLLYRCLRR